MKKQEFKVGDQVRLKKNLKANKTYGGVILLECMVFNGFSQIVSLFHNEHYEIYKGPYSYIYSSEMLTKNK